MATKVKLTLSEATTDKKYAWVDASGKVSWTDQETGGDGTKIAKLDADTLTFEAHDAYNIAVVGGTGYTADTTIASLAAGDSLKNKSVSRLWICARHAGEDSSTLSPHPTSKHLSSQAILSFSALKNKTLYKPETLC